MGSSPGRHPSQSTQVPLWTGRYPEPMGEAAGAAGAAPDSPGRGAVTLRPITAEDIEPLELTGAHWGDEFEFFGFRATNQLARWYAASGCLEADRGALAVQAMDRLVGRVSWHAVEYGPGGSSRALRIGIGLLPDARGMGFGSRAQDLLAQYLFATTLVHRVEAGTDIGNVAEQRALEKAGFVRDGVMREAQYRDGTWHDIALYSRLRTDG